MYTAGFADLSTCCRSTHCSAKQRIGEHFVCSHAKFTCYQRVALHSCTVPRVPWYCTKGSSPLPHGCERQKVRSRGERTAKHNSGPPRRAHDKRHCHHAAYLCERYSAPTLPYCTIVSSYLAILHPHQHATPRRYCCERVTSPSAILVGGWHRLRCSR